MKRLYFLVLTALFSLPSAWAQIDDAYYTGWIRQSSSSPTASIACRNGYLIKIIHASVSNGQIHINALCDAGPIKDGIHAAKLVSDRLDTTKNELITKIDTEVNNMKKENDNLKRVIIDEVSKIPSIRIDNETKQSIIRELKAYIDTKIK